MIVNYKKLNILRIPIPGDKSVTLKPGINEVPPADWDAALKASPIVPGLVDDGDILVKRTESLLDLGKMPLDKALKTVKDILDRDRLLALQKQPGLNGAVMKAIADQIETVTPKAEDEEPKGGKLSRK